MEKPSGLRRGCSSLFIQGFDSPLHLYQTNLIMSEKNQPIYFGDEYDEIIHPDYRGSMNGDPEDNVVYGDSMSEEEFADSGFVIIYLFIALALMALIITLFHITFH